MMEDEHIDLLQAEKFYVPWLLDLAYLDRNFLSSSSFRMNFNLRYEYPDGSNGITDGVAIPDIVHHALVAHSFIEKSLKFICVLKISGMSYASVKNIRHNLPKLHNKIVSQIPDLLQGMDSELKEFYSKFLSVNYTNLRYLDIEEEFDFNVEQLKNLIVFIRELVMEIRFNELYLNDEKRELITKKSKQNPTLKVYWEVDKQPSKTIQRTDFSNIIGRKNPHLAFRNNSGGMEHYSDNRLSDEEIQLIKDSYSEAESGDMKLNEEGLSEFDKQRLFEAFRKVDFVFLDYSNHKVQINTGEPL